MKLDNAVASGEAKIDPVYDDSTGGLLVNICFNPDDIIEEDFLDEFSHALEIQARQWVPRTEAPAEWHPVEVRAGYGEDLPPGVRIAVNATDHFSDYVFCRSAIKPAGVLGFETMMREASKHWTKRSGEDPNAG
ncbi:hypothetical protein ABZ312_11720 [Streptomyces sp. NPDC006207]